MRKKGGRKVERWAGRKGDGEEEEGRKGNGGKEGRGEKRGEGREGEEMANESTTYVLNIGERK